MRNFLLTFVRIYLRITNPNSEDIDPAQIKAEPFGPAGLFENTFRRLTNDGLKI